MPIQAEVDQTQQTAGFDLRDAYTRPTLQILFVCRIVILCGIVKMQKGQSSIKDTLSQTILIRSSAVPEDAIAIHGPDYNVRLLLRRFSRTLYSNAGSLGVEFSPSVVWKHWISRDKPKTCDGRRRQNGKKVDRGRFASPN